MTEDQGLHLLVITEEEIPRPGRLQILDQGLDVVEGTRQNDLDERHLATAEAGESAMTTFLPKEMGNVHDRAGIRQA